MDETSAGRELGDPTPIFGAFRRGYDPDQVDRYVADQRRRLDEALNRASEAERRLAAAVGQLRELHRRVAVLESEERTQQPQPLDTLGERVQRILQESWDGAYAIRQSVEQEANELRARATTEAEEIITAAQRKADATEEEIVRRRRAYLEQIEQERSRTASQMTYLHEQRTLAVADLNRIKTSIEATVSEVDSGADPRRDRAPERRERSPERSPALVGAHAGAASVLEGLTADEPVASGPRDVVLRPRDASMAAPARGVVVSAPPAGPAPQRVADEDLARTMPVHRLDLAAEASESADRAGLVQSHREAEPEGAEVREIGSGRRSTASVFDFEAEEPQ